MAFPWPFQGEVHAIGPNAPKSTLRGAAGHPDYKVQTARYDGGGKKFSPRPDDRAERVLPRVQYPSEIPGDNREISRQVRALRKVKTGSH